MKMRIYHLILATWASIVTADYVCPAVPSMTDAKALAFGYTVQGLIESYYESVPVNASFFMDLPMASMTASNGQTLAQNTVSNVEGLAKQATLGAKALMEMGSMLGLTPPPCTYAFPPASNGTTHLMNAYYIEATLCGAFIGLADYFQSPVLNSLSARLAAEHGIHASAIRAMMQAVGFMANSTMLTPAFTPDMILQTGNEVGMLGSILGGCVSAPAAPCSGTVSFGDLLPILSGQTIGKSNMTTSTTTISSGQMPAAMQTASVTQIMPAQYTGAATRLRMLDMTLGGVILAGTVLISHL
jgi:hypothetical protein